MALQQRFFPRVCAKWALASLLLIGSSAYAQDVGVPQQIDIASLELPAEYRLPPHQANTPALDVAPLTPPQDDRGNSSGVSPNLERQLRWKKARDLEIAFQALNAIDAAQTVSCLRREACWEANPIFGRNPSTGKVIGVKLIAGLGHFLVTRQMVRKNSPILKAWQIGSVAIQGGAVAWNTQFMF